MRGGGFTSSRKPRRIPGLQEVFPHWTWDKCACFVKPQLPATMICITAHPPSAPLLPWPFVTQFFRPTKPLHPTWACPVPSGAVINPHSGRAQTPARNNTDSFPEHMFCISTRVNSWWCSQYGHDILAMSHLSLDQTLSPARHLVCGTWTLATKQDTQLCVFLYTHTPTPSSDTFYQCSTENHLALHSLWTNN